MNTETTLITGASSGIGLHLAHEFAAHGHPVVLVAPVEAELQALAADLNHKYNVNCTVVAADLTEADAPQRIFDALKATGVQVSILVNNAGLGMVGKFWDISMEKYLEIIRLNVEAVVRMTRLFLPSMIQHGHGKILNVASVAGFEPGPNFAVYHASKAFVLSLSEALSTEAENTGVTVTALCPGPTDTDFFPKAEMMGVAGVQKTQVMSPQAVAHEGYEALFAEDRVHVPGVANKALVFGRRILPGGAQAKLNEKMYEEVPPEDRKMERGDKEQEAAAKFGH